MATPDRLNDKWRQGIPTTGMALALPAPLAAEAIAASGWDCVTIDMQHGALTDADMLTLLQAMAASPTVPFVRVPWNSPAAIMKALDAGALGLFCPLIETGAEAAAFVAACHYPPHGIRSIGPLLATARHGADYVKATAPKILSFAMIESQAGLDNLAEILATPRLTGLYVGSADLALSLTGTAVFNPDDPIQLQAVTRIAETTQDAGKIPAIHIVDMAHAAPMRALGYQHIVYANDYRLMMQAVHAAHHALATALSL